MEEPSVPLVLTRDREELDRLQAHARARARRRTLAALLVAALVHGAVAWWYYQQVVLPARLDEELFLYATLQDAAPLEPPPPLPPPDLEPPPEPVLEPVFSTDPPPSAESILGLGGSSPAGALGSGHSALPAMVTSDFGGPIDGEVGSPFVAFVTDLRARGLDVVFVMDATGSMQRFIERTRQAIGGIMADLSAVVPGLHLGLVAYRDLDDPWVTKVADLSADRFGVHNFLLDLDAAGGRRGTIADFEEAVEVGLATAMNGLTWRPGARRVILLIGDAPYHAEDRTTVLSLVRNFAREPHSVVNTIYVGSGDRTRATENQTRAREAFALVARTGGGTAFELVAEDPQADALIRQRVTEATFGPEWKEDVARFLERAPRDPRLRSVRRHVEAGNRRWLLRRLLAEDVHPAVVDGAVALFDPTLAAACLAVFTDEARPRPTRSACLYVLKRSLDSARGLVFDVDRPLADQQQTLAALRRRVETLQLQGSRVAAPPPPPPPPSEGGPPPGAR